MYKTLGHYLQSRGFATAQWLNSFGALQSFTFQPDWPCFEDGRPSSRGFYARYGKDSLGAKGWPGGRPHGGATDGIQWLINHPSNPLQLENNAEYILSQFEDESDLNYLPGAWDHLVSLAGLSGFDSNPNSGAGPGSGTSSDSNPNLSPIEARIEELRSMGLELLGGYKDSTLKSLHDMLENKWPVLKVFVAAGLRMFRRITK